MVNHAIVRLLLPLLSLPSIAQENIIVKFNYTFLDDQFIDNERVTAPLSDLFNQKAERELTLLNNAFPQLLNILKAMTQTFNFTQIPELKPLQ